MDIQEKTKNQDLPHYHVTAGLIRNGNKILITQRMADSKFGGLWEFPGGKQEPGETLEECLIREILEELNIQIVINNYLFSIDHTYDNLQITLHVFLCRYNCGVPECRQVQDWKWIELFEVNGYEFTTADKKVIQKLSAFNK